MRKSLPARFMGVAASIACLLSGPAFAQGAEPGSAASGALGAARADKSSEKVTVTAAVRGNRLEVTYAIPPEEHIALQKDFLYIEPDPMPGIEFGETVYPEPDKKPSGETPYFSGKLVLAREFRVTAPVQAGTVLTVEAGWQTCLDSGVCLMPQDTKLSLSLPALLPEASAAPAPETAASPEAEEVTPASTARPAQASGDVPQDDPPRSIWYFAMLAFFGGMILNLMPCVLPVLSIKMLGIVKSAHTDARTLRNGALAYTVGVLLSFAALAILVIAIQAGGAAAGWGFQFQNPGFVTALLVIIWVFSLSLFEVFLIRVPGMQAASQASAQHGLSGSFFSGVFAVLLATPCMAPMLGTAMGFAFSQPPAIILLMFLLVGAGLALPFFVVGFIPAAARIVPKPGNWMNAFREIMGFLLLATCVWLLNVLSIQIGAHIRGVIWYLLVLSIACWVYGRFANVAQPLAKQWIFTAVAVGIAVGGWLWLVDLRPDPRMGARAGQGAESSSGWGRFSPERVAELREAGKPVFIDFGAEWCMTCKANEEAVLFTDSIQKAFRDRGVVLLRGDYTVADPVITEWLRKYNRPGVPLYLYYAPNTAEPVVLPVIITKSMVLDMLERQ